MPTDRQHVPGRPLDPALRRRAGQPWRHWAAFGVAAIGSVNALIVAVPLALAALGVVALIAAFVASLAVLLVGHVIAVGAAMVAVPFLVVGGAAVTLAASAAMVSRLLGDF